MRENPKHEGVPALLVIHTGTAKVIDSSLWVAICAVQGKSQLPSMTLLEVEKMVPFGFLCSPPPSDFTN
jgi:hypothetical protein